MNKNFALKVAGTVFLLVSLAQLSRVILKVKVVAADSFVVPVWLSAVAFVFLLSLALWMFKAGKK